MELTFETYARNILVRDVQDRIRRRELTQWQWKLWYRWRRSGNDNDLRILVNVLTILDEIRAARRILEMFFETA